MLDRVRAVAAPLALGAGSLGRLALHTGAGLIVVAIGFGWAFGKEPLQRAVASIRSVQTQVRFNWPVAVPPGSKTPRNLQTWMPAPVQHDLARIASEQISVDPFDQTSLERARQALMGTGWFARITSIERTASGQIDVSADWRLPAAVVHSGGQDYLVAVSGEILKLPPRTPVARGSMPIISNPHFPPPTDELGVVYGKPWEGGDVQAAIDLLRNLRQLPESRRLSGIDLSEFIRTGHLTLLTDAGARIVWGSSLADLGPGEVPHETRRARLKQILADRFDTEQRFIEIHTPVVLVDKTVARQ